MVGRTPPSAGVPLDPLLANKISCICAKQADESVGCGPGNPPRGPPHHLCYAVCPVLGKLSGIGRSRLPRPLASVSFTASHPHQEAIVEKRPPRLFPVLPFMWTRLRSRGTSFPKRITFISMNLRSLFSLFSSDLAIDLGTANTLVFAKGKGIVVNEPSIVAINKNNGEIEAVGKEAKEMLGRTPGNIVAIRPMKDGVIADFKVTERMLGYFIQKAHGRKMLVHPRIVIGVPSEITQVEKRAVIDSAYRAKASEVHLVEQAMVAAIGAGLPVTEPSGNMVVDIGGGTTDVAVISLSGIVYSRSVRGAGNEIDNAIMQYLKRKYNLLIGERTAEAIKIQIGPPSPHDPPPPIDIQAPNLIEGVPRTISVNDTEIREALGECVATIINAIRVALERTPPELSADISDRGIVLTGGGALLKNLDKRIRERTGLPVALR